MPTVNETMGQPRTGIEIAKKYGILAYGALGTMLDTGLMVLGSLLVGLGVTVLLSGFGLVGQIAEMSTAALLSSSLILVVVGLFAIGLAAEGPLGKGRSLSGFELWEVGIGRALASFLVGLGLLLIHRTILGLVDDLPVVFLRGADGLHSVAVAGMVAVPLVGVPLSLFLRTLPDDYAWARRLQMPMIFAVWLLTTLILL